MLSHPRRSEKSADKEAFLTILRGGPIPESEPEIVPHGLFEGVCVTTVILAPGACGDGLRAAVLDTTSVASVAPVLCSRRLDFVGRHRKR